METEKYVLSKFSLSNISVTLTRCGSIPEAYYVVRVIMTGLNAQTHIQKRECVFDAETIFRNTVTYILWNHITSLNSFREKTEEFVKMKGLN